MKSVVVFCGSSEGKDKTYVETAFKLGERLAHDGIKVIYGGSKAGMMGAVANGALKQEGQVIGVLPNFLKHKEVAHTGLTEMIIVKSMHERKTIMHELCEGIIALPGGYGTMEELFEVLTWAQLGHHEMPIGLLNIDGYYDNLIAMVQKMVDHGYSNSDYQSMLLVAENIEELLDKMRNYKAPKVHKWIAADEL